MNWLVLIASVLLLAGAAALLYWLLNLAEGVYFGRRVVVWLYDRFAPRYDTVKKFDEKDEAWFIGEPLTQALSDVPLPLVLDVATGTARLPLALCRQPGFPGRIIALDMSRQMLRHAATNSAAYQDRVTLLWQDATQLPFPEGVFDAVTCLEALEFLPDARGTLGEMVRVLRPGGILLASNRIGPGVRWIPGRTLNREAFITLLETLALDNVRASAWQVDYDLVWARKPGSSTYARPPTLPALLCCPRCADGRLVRQERAFCCASCASRYPIADDGVVEMGW